jgi:hypothetical protein
MLGGVRDGSLIYWTWKGSLSKPGEGVPILNITKEEITGWVGERESRLGDISKGGKTGHCVQVREIWSYLLCRSSKAKAGLGRSRNEISPAEHTLGKEGWAGQGRKSRWGQPGRTFVPFPGGIRSLSESSCRKKLSQPSCRRRTITDRLSIPQAS